MINPCPFWKISQPFHLNRGDPEAIKYILQNYKTERNGVIVLSGLRICLPDYALSLSVILLMLNIVFSYKLRYIVGFGYEAYDIS